jgi:uncharacterized protein
MKSKAKIGFSVSDYWPIGPPELRKRAVQALLANHTLIVGQSRSGKTQAARRLLEEILAWTDTRVVILDPNADFRWLGQVADSTADPTGFADRWGKLGRNIAIVADEPGATGWGIDWANLSLHDMAAFLRLTPSENFAEYQHLKRHLDYFKTKEQKKKGSTIEDFRKSKYLEIASGEELARYSLMLERLEKLEVWARKGRKDLDSVFKRKYRATVVDLSKDDEQVRMITAARVLEVLWRRGEVERKRFLQDVTLRWPGTLVVVDEGHLFAPPAPEDPQKRLVGERIHRFADQGKKLNLYLMVITQQPGKLHRDVLSEFNNRIIMRVNERASLGLLEQTYVGGGQGRYDGALTFDPGDALIEGACVIDEIPTSPTPRAVHFKMGRTKEGGGSPKLGWAEPKHV